MTIKAITFDLWDTVLDDGSDEPKRRQAGLESKTESRHKLLFEALNRHHSITLDEMSRAWVSADTASYTIWQEKNVTWTCKERLEVVLDELECDLPDQELAEIADAMGRMEVETPPNILPDADVAIAELASRYKLAVISDTIITPGPGLRQILVGHGIAQHFSGFAFSDEVGRSKPDPAMFHAAREQVGAAFHEMVHIGDRDNKDIKGAQSLGMKAILYVEKRDQDRATTSADAICERHADLPDIIAALDKD